jgi:hypothetical protein
VTCVSSFAATKRVSPLLAVTQSYLPPSKPWQRKVRIYPFDSTISVEPESIWTNWLRFEPHKAMEEPARGAYPETDMELVQRNREP